MSEHAWVIDNLAAYVAGGLDAEECERVDVHVAQCEPCTAALQDARVFDHGMESLFAPTRPALAMEDRIIQVFRAVSRPRSQPHWGRKLAWGAAATVALGATGAAVSQLSPGGGLPFPGTVNDDIKISATNNLRPLAPVLGRSRAGGLTDKSTEAESNKRAEALERVEKSQSSFSVDFEGAASGALGNGEQNLEGNGVGFFPPAMAVVTDGSSNTVGYIATPENRPVQGEKAEAQTGDAGRSSGLRTFKDPTTGKFTAMRGFGSTFKENQWKDDASAGRSSDTNFYAVPGGANARYGPPLTTGNFQTGSSNSVVMGDGSVRSAPGGGGPPAGMMGGGPGMMGGGGMGMMGGGGGLGMMGGPGMGTMGSTGTMPGGKADGKSPAWKAEDKPRSEDGDEKKSRLQAPIGAPGSTPPVADAFVPEAHAAKMADAIKDLKQALEDQNKRGEAEKAYSLALEMKARIDGQSAQGKSGKEDKLLTGLHTAEAPGPAQQVDPKKTQTPAEQPAARKVIRSGDIEFEVPSFDSAAAAVTKLVTNIKGAFVATINSDKLPNGKVRGSLVVRVPPDALDTLVLDLRRELGKDGELKGLKIGSQDITKQYYDLESRLKAAKTMQERLLKIIADGKGEIKQLLEAEKELGVWRTKIEEFEGEIRYYNSVVSLSTLNVVLAEKEIRSAVDVVEREMVETGIEVEDVDKAREATLTAVADAKGRVTKAELKQFAAGQYNATLNFEVPADKAGAIRDRLRQIGTMVRLEINRTQQAEGGQATRDAKIRRGDAVFAVSLYNVTGMGVRETSTAQIAAPDVPAAYRGLQDAVAKVKGHMITGQLNEQDRANITAKLDFEVRRADEAAIQTALAAAGEIVSRNVVRAQANQNITDAKVRFQVDLKDVTRLAVRETTTMKLATPDVPATYRSLQDAVAKVKGYVVKAQLSEQDRNNIMAEFTFEIRRDDDAAIQAALAAGGEVITRAVGRSQQQQDVTDSRVRYETVLYNAGAIPPRETIKLLIESNDVEATAAVFASFVKESGGRILGSEVGRERDGRSTALLAYEVPLAAEPTVADQLKKGGKVHAQQSIRNPQAPDGKLATARINLTLVGTDSLVPQDEGFWPKVRGGLGTSVRFLLFSVSWIIFGVLVLLPWALVGYGAYRLGRRMFAPAATPAPAMAALSSTPPAT